MNAMTTGRALIALAMLATSVACVGTGEQSDCSKMCDTLMRDCTYEAYPTTESCLQGCQYNADNGGDVAGQKACLDEATADDSCDTFAVIECENAYGATGEPSDDGEDDAAE